MRWRFKKTSVLLLVVCLSFLFSCYFRGYIESLHRPLILKDPVEFRMIISDSKRQQQQPEDDYSKNTSSSSNSSSNSPNIECNTPSCRRIKNYSKALFQLIPRNFFKSFHNPCWYSSIHIPSDLSNYFRILRMFHPSIFNTNTSSYTPYSTIREFNITTFVHRTLSESHTRQRLFCLPYVYLAGFPKCGTTTLYQLLVKHPLVAKPLRKEGHFWSMFTEDSATHSEKLLHTIWYLDQFQDATKNIAKNPKSITIDASPSTLWRVESPFEEEMDLYLLPSLVKELSPQSRFIVIMRDPVERLFSDFWFFCSHQNWIKGGKMVIPEYYIKHGKQIFHNLTAEAILDFQSCVNNASSGVTAFYECVRRATVKPEFRATVGPNVCRKLALCRATVAPDFHGATINHVDTMAPQVNGTTVVPPETNRSPCFPIRLGIGLYYYHIVRWLKVIPREQFLFLRSEDLSTEPYSTMENVWSFLELPSLSRQYIEAVLSRKNRWNSNNWIRSEQYRDRFSILPETETMLKNFYRPHNELLAQLL